MGTVTYSGLSVEVDPTVNAQITALNLVSNTQLTTSLASYLTIATYNTNIASYLTTASASATYATKASPTFTGTVTIPAGASISGFATLASPTFTGDPRAPTPLTSDNDTSIATTAYVKSNLSSYATTASPTFSGTPSLPTGTVAVTQTTSDNSTKLATTAFVKNQSYLTTSTASSTYQTLSGMASYVTYGVAAITYQPIGSYLTDAPSDGNQYARQSGTWTVVTGGGGGASGIALYDNGVTYSVGTQVVYSNRIFYLSTYVGGAGYDPIGYPSYWTEISASAGGSVAWGGITGTVTDQTDLVSYITGLGYLTTVPAKTLNTISASSYMLAAGDENKVHFLTGGMSGATLILPADTTYAFPAGTEITVVCDDTSMNNMNIGIQWAGQPLVNGVWGVPVTSKVSKLVKIGTDLWLYT
jgi:hypothetical protein